MSSPPTFLSDEEFNRKYGSVGLPVTTPSSSAGGSGILSDDGFAKQYGAGFGGAGASGTYPEPLSPWSPERLGSSVNILGNRGYDSTIGAILELLKQGGTKAIEGPSMPGTASPPGMPKAAAGLQEMLMDIFQGGGAAIESQAQQAYAPGQDPFSSALHKAGAFAAPVLGEGVVNAPEEILKGAGIGEENDFNPERMAGGAGDLMGLFTNKLVKGLAPGSGAPASALVPRESPKFKRIRGDTGEADLIPDRPKTMGERRDSAAIKSFEKVLGGAPGGMAIFDKFHKTQTQWVSELGDKLINDISTARSDNPVTLGKYQQKVWEGIRKEGYAISRKNYEAADDLAGARIETVLKKEKWIDDAPGKGEHGRLWIEREKVTPVQEWKSDVMVPQDGPQAVAQKWRTMLAKTADPATLAELDAIIKGHNTLTFSETQDMRTNFRQKAKFGDKGMAKNQAQAIYVQMEDAYDASMKKAADDSGIEGLPEAVEFARSSYKTFRQDFQSGLIDKVIKTKNPEIAHTFLNNVGYDDAQRFMQYAPRELRQQVKALRLQQDLDAALVHVSGTKNDKAFHPDILEARFKKIGKEGAKRETDAVIHSPHERNSRQQILEAAREISENRAAAGRLGTGMMTPGGAVAGTVGMTPSPGGIAKAGLRVSAALGITQGLSKIVVHQPRTGPSVVLNYLKAVKSGKAGAMAFWGARVGALLERLPPEAQEEGAPPE